MKILFYIYDDAEGRGGAETILHMSARELLRQGEEVYVFFLNPRSLCEWDEDNERLHLVYTMNKGPIRFLQLILNFWRHRKVDFDASFTSLVDTNGAVGFFRRLGILRIKHTVGRESTLLFKRYHGLALKRKLMMYRLGYPAMDTLICQSEEMRLDLEKALPWVKKRSSLRVVPNPVNITAIKEHINDVLPTYAQRFGKYIVTAGRFIPAKAYDVLFDAFSILLLSYPVLTLVVLGEGDLRQSYEKQIKDLGIDKKVLMPGFADNVYPFFREAQLCVVSSRIEGFPNVLLQMMSQNTKVVSTTCAGGIDQIDGLYTCGIDDAPALAKAMENCLNDDTSENRELFDRELASRSIERYNKIIFS